MLDNQVVQAAGEKLAPMSAFFWAAGGSFALEVISLYNEIKAERASGLPKYYRSPVFWIVRLMVTGIAGGLAVAESASNPLLAVNIGASAPAILQLLTKPPRPDYLTFRRCISEAANRALEAPPNALNTFAPRLTVFESELTNQRRAAMESPIATTNARTPMIPIVCQSGDSMETAL